MNNLMDKVVEYRAKKMSCSQTMFLLSKEYHKLDDKYVVRMLDGLSAGMYTKDICGAYSGACCVLALYLGKTEVSLRDSRIKRGAEELKEWFEATHGTRICKELLGDKEKDDVCPNLVFTTFMKTKDILEGNGIDLKNIGI